MFKKLALSVLGLVFFLIALVLIKFEIDSAEKHTAPDFSISSEVENADLELGKRIFTVRSACIDCHGENLAGVQVMDNGPIGSIHGANLTPFNLQSWSDEDIARAIRYGIHKSGRALRFMPAFDYVNLSKGDLAAVIRYIRSAAPVEKKSVENSFGPVAKLMSVMRKMPVMLAVSEIDLTKGFSEKPPEEATLEFGKYLAGACVGCHGQKFVGGLIPGGDPSWPAAGNLRFGANAAWSKDKFVEMIRTGISPITHAELRIPMPIWLLKKYNETEIEALWLFLSSLK